MHLLRTSCIKEGKRCSIFMYGDLINGSDGLLWYYLLYLQLHLFGLKEMEAFRYFPIINQAQ